MLELTVDNIKNGYGNIEILDNLSIVETLQSVALNYRSFINFQRIFVEKYGELKITKGTLRKFKVIYKG